MLPENIIKKIKLIQIRTRKILSGATIGNYTTKFKGIGPDFDQIRDYQESDDVRFIDWKSSARTNKLLIKECYEEKNRTIIIILDISKSLFYTSSNINKYNIAAQIATVITFIADYNKDNIGLILFSDKIDKFIYPANSKTHVNYIVEYLLNSENIKNKNNKSTNISIALEYVAKNIKKNSYLFLISDFIDENNYEKQLRFIAKNYNLISIRCFDKNENTIPNMGFMNLCDIETSKTLVINSSLLNKINTKLYDYNMYYSKLFKLNKISLLDINNEEFALDNFINKLIELI